MATVTPSTPKGGQLSLPVISRRRLPVVMAQPESVVQQSIIQALALYGLQVLVTSRVRKRVRCAGCGAWSWQQGGDGVTKGCPDLLVRRAVDSRHGRAWTHMPFFWLGMEVKPHRKAKIRPEQQALADAGSIVIVYSSEEALAAVAEVDNRHSG